MSRGKTCPLLRALIERFPDRTKDDLYARIMCGEVAVDGIAVKNPKADVSFDSQLEFKRERYVSRGGYKLEGALDDHHIVPKAKVVLDAGSSTGGFTHCLLLNGASHVHSVDVGYNQLAYSLRSNPRVIVHERCNVMNLTELVPRPNIAVADLSFRSLYGAASYILTLVCDNILLALVKPQFEWRDPPATFRGVIHSSTDILRVLKELVELLSENGIRIFSVSESRVRGRHGNREFFFLLRRERPNPDEAFDKIKAAVDAGPTKTVIQPSHV